jgi:hypothetical protein
MEIINTMNYRIQRVIKSKSREGDEELFIHIAIDDDLGLYAFGKWLTPKEIKEIVKDFGRKEYDKCENIVDFKLKKQRSKLDDIIESYLPEARKQRLNG